jgi:PAS domain-containing protein
VLRTNWRCAKHEIEPKRNRDSRRSVTEPLAGNPHYGICRCSLDGKFLEVNDAMTKMRGYSSREELLAMNLGSDIAQSLAGANNCLSNLDREGRLIKSK